MDNSYAHEFNYRFEVQEPTFWKEAYLKLDKYDQDKEIQPSFMSMHFNIFSCFIHV